jgi:hypothetical protein
MLCLRFCSRLENFPKIECEMERLSDLRLEFIAIEELPSFPIYFTGLSNLSVNFCKNLTHLPSSIFKSHHLDSLCVKGCPNLVILPTDVRDERQSMLSIESTEETNSSISDVGCSSVVFPALTGVKLVEMSLDPKIPGDLDIPGSEIDSLPTWIKTFVRLGRHCLKKCKQLLEILELPAKFFGDLDVFLWKVFHKYQEKINSIQVSC